MISRHCLKSRLGVYCLLFFFLGCSDQKFPQGQRIYAARCSNCHMDDGNGLGKLIPSLKNKNLSLNTSQVVCTIINGINADSLGETISVMPSSADMTEVEMTNLLNYLSGEFWESEKFTTILETTKHIENCKLHE